MCNIDWDGGQRYWRDEKRRAAKLYACDSCGASIAAGDRYVNHSSLSEDASRPWNERMCLVCDALMDEFGSEPGHPGRTTPSSLPEYIGQCIEALNDEGMDYDEAADEFKPREQARRWIAALDEIQARKAASHG